MAYGRLLGTVLGMTTTTTTNTVPPHETIWTITNGATSTRSLQLVAELGVADHIDDRPVPVEDLASRCGVQPGPLDRVLRLLVANGVFDRGTDGYVHTEPCRLLRSDHPRSMRAFTRMMGLPLFWHSFGALDHSLRTGAPGLEKAEHNGLFGYLQAHPDEARIFDDAMTPRRPATSRPCSAGTTSHRSRRSPTSAGGGGT